MEKKKIMIGAKIYLKGAKKPSEIKAIKSEPIYADWTPELQKGQDEIMKKFAYMVTYDLLEYARSGGDMNNLTTDKVYGHLQVIHQGQERLEGINKKN